MAKLTEPPEEPRTGAAVARSPVPGFSDVPGVALPTSQGVYGITVTSDLVGTGAQNLRAYERAGLVDPSRTAGGTRLYSTDDVARLRRIQELLARGLNLAGVSMVLDLQDDNQHLRERLDRD